jgi:hypothetical protein
MAKQLLFDSDFTAEYKGEDIKDGSITIDKLEFMVGKAKPLLVKKKGFLSRFLGTSATPLYLLKWNILLPAHFKVDEKKGKLNVLKDKIQSEDLKKDIEKKIEKDKSLGDREFVFRELVPMDVEFPVNKPDEKGNYLTPEMLRSTVDMRFLKGLKDYAAPKGKKNFMNILFIGGIIIVVFVALAMTGVIGQ